MPKIPPRTTGPTGLLKKLSEQIASEESNRELDTNGVVPSRGTNKEARFEAYAFMEVNRAQWPESSGYPELIIRSIDFETIGNGIGSVQEKLKRMKKKPSGMIVRVSVTVLEELEVG